MDLLKIFKSYLANKSLKLTKERIAIIEGIKSLGGHFDLDELLIELRKKGIKVSKASIYRSIPLLKDCGIINEVIYKDKHSHYEFVYGNKHHDHMICLNCGKIIEFTSPSIEKLQERVCKENDFYGMSHMLEIKGFCKTCR
ncbi:MAG TPA: transcriptional repressor [Nitrospiraceae bacterium]|nr:transcriptional repressor [Nitrospiraceae bacterium]